MVSRARGLKCTAASVQMTCYFDCLNAAPRGQKHKGRGTFEGI